MEDRGNKVKTSDTSGSFSGVRSTNLHSKTKSINIKGSCSKIGSLARNNDTAFNTIHIDKVLDNTLTKNSVNSCVLKMPRYPTLGDAPDTPLTVGDIIFVEADGCMYYHDGTTWVKLGTGGGGANTVTLNSLGGGESIVVESMGPDLLIKSFESGEGITIDCIANTLVFSANIANIPNIDISTLTGVGTGEDLVIDGVGPDLEIKNILGNGFVDVSTEANDVVIELDANLVNAEFIFSNSVPDGFPNGSVLTGGNNINIVTASGNTTISFIGNTGDDVKLDSVGTGNSLVFSNTSPCLEIKSISAGTGIIINDSGTTLTIEANVDDMFSGLTGVGTGEDLVIDGTGPDLEIKNILGNGLIDVDTVANDVVIGLNANLTDAEFIFSNSVPDGFSNGSVLTGGNNINIVTADGNTTISFIGNTGDDVKLNSVGTGNSLVFSNTGPCLEIKSISAGTGIVINDSGNTLSIEANVDDMFSGLTGVGTGEDLVIDGTGPDLEIKNILGNGFVDVDTVANDVVIGLNANLTDAEFIFSNSVPDGFPNGSVLTGGNNISIVTADGNTTISFIGNTGDDVKLDSVGTGNSLVFSNTGPCLEIKSISAGTGIVINDSGTTLTVEANVDDMFSGLAGVGTGEDLVVDGTGPDLEIKNILGNGFVDVDTVANDIVIGLDANLTEAEFIFSNSVPDGFPNGSVLTGGNNINIVTADGNTTISFIGNTGDDVKLDSVGTGNSLVFSNTGPCLEIKSISAGMGIVINDSGNTISIEANVDDMFSGLTGVGTGEDLVIDGTGPDLEIKNILGNGFVDVDTVANDVVIGLNANLTDAEFIFSNSVPDGFPNGSVLTGGNNISIVTADGNTTVSFIGNTGDDVKLDSVGIGNSLVFSNTGPCLEIKSISAGMGVIINDSGTTLTIEANVSGELSDLTGVGTGEDLVIDGTGPDLEIKNILGNGFVDVDTVANDVVIGLNANLTDAEFIFSNSVPDGFPNGSVLTGGNNISIVTSSGNTTVSFIGNTGDDIKLDSVGTGNSLVFSNTGPCLEIKSISAGMGIVINDSGNTISIEANVDDMFSGLTGVGTGEDLVVDGTGPDLEIKNILGNGFVDVSTEANDVVIGLNANLTDAEFIFSNSVPDGFPNGSVLISGNNINIVTTSGNTIISFIGNTGDDVKLDSVGTGNSLVFSNTGPCLEIKSISAGTGIIINDSGNTLSIEANVDDMFSGLTGVGTGEDLVINGTGPDLEIKNILGNGLIDVDTVANDVVIGLNANLTEAEFIFSNSVPDGFPNGSVLTGGNNISITTVSGNTTISFIGNTGDDVKLDSVGTGNSLVFSNTGPCLEIKSILAGMGIVINDSGNTLSIEANVNDMFSGLTGVGTGEDLVINGTGPNLTIRNILGNGLIDVDTVANDVIIGLDSNLVNAEFVFSNNVPDGFPNGSILTAGNNINIVTASGNTTISFVGNTGDDVTLTGIGTGEDLVVDGIGPDLTVKNILGNGFVDVDTVSDNIVIGLNANLTEAEFVFSNNVPDGFPNGSILTAGNEISITTASGNTTISFIGNTGDDVTLTGIGTGEDLVVDGIGPDLEIKNILGNGFVDVDTVSDNIVIGLNANLTNAEFVFSNSVPDGFPNGSILTAGNNINITTASGNTTISFIGNTGDDVKLDSVGTGNSLVFSNIGPCLEIKSISAGTGVIINDSGTTLTIEANVNSTLSDLTGVGNGENLVVNGTGPDLEIKNILGNGLIETTTVANDIVIELNANLTNAEFIFSNSVPDGFPNGSILTAGNNINITTASGNTTISFVGNTGDDVTLTGIGTGENLVVDGTGPDLTIKNITGNGLINVDTINNDIDISLDSNLLDASFIFSGDVPESFANGSVLTAGDGIIINTTGNVTSVASNISLSSLGTGNIDLVVNGLGSDLTIQTLEQGNGILLESNANTVTISVDPNTIVLSTELVSSNVTVNGTTTTYTTMVGMSITPAEGEYIVSFSGSAASATSSQNQIDYAIFKENTIAQDSERNFGYSTNNNNKTVRGPIHTQTIISANGSETITTKYRINTGQFDIYNRSMILLKTE